VLLDLVVETIGLLVVEEGLKLVLPVELVVVLADLMLAEEMHQVPIRYDLIIRPLALKAPVVEVVVPHKDNLDHIWELMVVPVSS
jgi:hypothetical protein